MIIDYFLDSCFHRNEKNGECHNLVLSFELRRPFGTYSKYLDYARYDGSVLRMAFL
jgi:hypothetical protein